MSTKHLALLLALPLCAPALLLSCSGEDAPLAAQGSSPGEARGPSPTRAEGAYFRRAATLPVFLNSDVEDEAVAEILSAGPGGSTLVYTDSAGERLGFIDLTDPRDPKPAGTIDVHGEPTSVACRGALALACVNRSKDHVETAGVLLVVDLATQEVLRELELGGQPDSVAVSPDGRFAAVAIENERDEGRDDGRMPQDPAGWLTIIDCQGEVADWTQRRVELTGLAELYPSDPEPEFVDINMKNQVVVTLQENNHVVVVDLASGDVLSSSACGAVDLDGVDVVADGELALEGVLTGVLREPDAVGWISDDAYATANEGDLDGGSRGFTTWTAGGEVLFDAGATIEHELVRLGHFPEDRADLDAPVHQLGGTIDLLVGHSMGGTIASLFAGLRPQAARCVVLVEGLGPPIFDATTAADQMVGFLDHQRTSRTHKVLEDVDAAALRLRRMNPALPPGLATALALRATRAAPGGVVWRWDALHRTRSAVAYDVDRHMAILARITAPVTVVLGTRSWYPGLPDLGTRLAAIPTLVARHDVDAGHAVQLDQPALLARLLRAAAGSAGLAAYP